MVGLTELTYCLSCPDNALIRVNNCHVSIYLSLSLYISIYQVPGNLESELRQGYEAQLGARVTPLSRLPGRANKNILFYTFYWDIYSGHHGLVGGGGFF